MSERMTRVYDNWRDVPDNTLMVDSNGDKFRVIDGILYWHSENEGWYVAEAPDGAEIIDFGPVTEVAL